MNRLTDAEQAMVKRLESKAARQAPLDKENLAYYLGKQRIQFLGLRLRDEWIRQAFPLTWCRTLVNVIVERQQVQRLLRRGNFSEDKNLRAAWDASDMDSQMYRLATDLAIYGRCYISVAMSAGQRPRMQAEPVSAMTVVTDALGNTEAAMRRFWDDDLREVRRVVYFPDYTLIFGERANGEPERIEHGLGRVPVVMAVMGDIDGSRQGTAVFEPIKRIADTSAETMLNARVALETVASPQKVFIDAVNEVVDEDGNPVSVFEAFYDSVLTVFSGEQDATSGKTRQADVKQLAGADMTGFFKTIEMLGQQASSASGLPMRMLGHVTANPPSEMTVRGEESRLVRMVDNYNASLGAALGWALGIDERLRSGLWPDDGSIDISWRDPGTPTVAQQADALTKYVQTGMMSKRSALEELGWSDSRIDREMQRMEEEAEPLGYLGRDPAQIGHVVEAEVVEDA